MVKTEEDLHMDKPERMKNYEENYAASGQLHITCLIHAVDSHLIVMKGANNFESDCKQLQLSNKRNPGIHLMTEEYYLCSAVMTAT